MRSSKGRVRDVILGQVSPQEGDGARERGEAPEAGAVGADRVRGAWKPQRGLGDRKRSQAHWVFWAGVTGCSS